MKGNKLEPLYLVLSIILLVITGYLYLSHSKKEMAVHDAITRTNIASREEATSKKIANLNKRLEEIAKNPTKDNVTAIKQEIQALEEGNDKEKLLQTLANIEKDVVAISNIEDNFSLAQSSGELTYLQTAQVAIDSLKAETKKLELQTRLDELRASLSQTNEPFVELVDEISEPEQEIIYIEVPVEEVSTEQEVDE